MSDAKPKPAAARRALEPGAYNDLVAHARLFGLRLTSSNFTIKPEALDEDRRHWAYQVSDRLQDWQLDCDALLLRGYYSYSAACIDGRRKPVRFTAGYLATFKLSRDCEEDAAVAYLKRVGRFSCYPYFRALFAILTEQSGLQLPPLPVISEQPRIVPPK